MNFTKKEDLEEWVSSWPITYPHHLGFRFARSLLKFIGSQVVNYAYGAPN